MIPYFSFAILYVIIIFLKVISVIEVSWALIFFPIVAPFAFVAIIGLGVMAVLTISLWRGK